MSRSLSWFPLQHRLRSGGGYTFVLLVLTRVSGEVVPLVFGDSKIMRSTYTKMVDRLFAGSYVRCLILGSSAAEQQRKRMDEYPIHQLRQGQSTCDDTINVVPLKKWWP
ncbi:unnamed protein product [Urochloa humidicola]